MLADWLVSLLVCGEFSLLSLPLDIPLPTMTLPGSRAPDGDLEMVLTTVGEERALLDGESILASGEHGGATAYMHTINFRTIASQATCTAEPTLHIDRVCAWEGVASWVSSWPLQALALPRSLSRQ